MKLDILEIYISRIPVLNTKERLFLLDNFISLEDILHCSPEDLTRILNRKFNGLVFTSTEILIETEKIVKKIYNSNIDILSFRSEKYPATLREIYDPPFLLYKKGGTINNELPSFAVVGTRQSTAMADRAAYNLGIEISDYGLCLVSGLASGIDSAAHMGAVKRKGFCVAVLGNGIDFIYPRENIGLSHDILDLGGVILSEYPPGTFPLGANFPARNRLISGLSNAVVVVEAPEKSGALITSDFALEQGRDVFVHGVSLHSRMGSGCRSLVSQGADVIYSLGDIIAYKEAV